MKLPDKLLAKAEAEYPKGSVEIRGVQRRIATESALALDGPEQFDLRRAMIAASAREDVAGAFERYIGTNDLLPINYLLSGHLQARAVGRIRYLDKREGKWASATGFMVSSDLMMTNHHVFPVSDLAQFSNLIDDPTLQFGDEFDLDGRRAEPVIHELDPAAFFHSFEPLDLAIVAVRPLDQRGRHKISEQGYLVLNGQRGKAGLGEYATIIQHPEGKDKQISIRNNEIIDISLADAIIYKSDTAPGSSGAPVFNNEWQIIALHSAGVAKKNAAGEYVDEDDKVIPVEGGKVDARRIVWLSNRGVRVSKIMEHLRSAGDAVTLHPMVQMLLSPAYTDSRPFASVGRPTVIAEELKADTAPIANVTTSLAAMPGPINIQISFGGDGRSIVSTGLTTLPAAGVLAALEQEKFEDDQDFSACEGFQAEFMADRIPMPVPGEALRKKLAYLTDSPNLYALKYHHYSTIHHAVRRVPVVSAINVYGNRRYEELGKESRKDKWFRDNRIDYDAQLDDQWYAKSGFDRGHLARREDAEWGTTMMAAKVAADMTCSYANAIPQVPALNRAIMGYHGMWGQLEGKLLEKGVTNEAGKSARICIFAGPVFEPDDPVYKSVQVALSCFKVVVWYDGTGSLRTTCFRLSQKKLVSDIDFEVLRFNEVFETSQRSLKQIESWTGLEFHARMHETDTSSGGGEIVTEETFERLVTGSVRR
jgi:endonuclease G, mitochondrial